jgi:hypothetical protein
VSSYKNSIVLIKLPRAGLGNKLIVWGHGIQFSDANKLKSYTIGWFDFKVGTFLRQEKRKRLYWGFFKRSIFDFSFFYKVLFYRKEYNPTTLTEKSKVVYIFNKLPEFPNYFLGINNSRELIREHFYKLVAEKHLTAISSSILPLIAVHVRRSDFVKNEDLEIGSVCNLQTPLEYFKEKIFEIRGKLNSNIEVTIFTDGNIDEVSELLLIENVRLSDDNLDIIDLLLMANAKYLIISPGSTFSLWAQFISNK